MLIDDVIKTAKRIHFIGIGGSGMCPLAEILHSRGHFLTGSDNNESDTLKRIRALGIPVTMGQRAENVEGADMVVFTAALLPDNPELVAAREKGIPAEMADRLSGETEEDIRKDADTMAGLINTIKGPAPLFDGEKKVSGTDAALKQMLHDMEGV